MAGVSATAGLVDTKDEYTEFFKALGLTDVQKTSYLTRLLESFYDVGAKLDEHLGPTGAVLHAAVSRTCQGENPTDAPHHRWIRVHDRLGFFADQDDHGSRIINIGLAYAYRHKELDALSSANTLRLEQLRLASAHKDPEESDRLPPGPDEVPDGGRVVRDDGVADALGNGSAHDAAGSQAAGGLVELSHKDKGLRDSVGLDVPNGGLEIRRDAPAGAAADGARTDQGGQDVPQLGGNVVARRGGPDQAAPPTTTTELLTVTAGVPSSIIFKTQPLVKPSLQAVQSTTALLEAFLRRSDSKGVVRELLVDALLCWGRLHSGQTAKAAAGVISALEVDAEWPAVRNLLGQCWPMWSSPVKNVAVAPPEGSVSRQTHPGRLTLTSRWKVKVDMTTINPTIRRFEIPSDRHFKKGTLDDCVEVQRIAPGMKVPLAVTIASFLLVATWDSPSCTIMQQLVTSGRAPVHSKEPIAAAACHDFESAGLELPRAPGSMVGAAADGTDGDQAALPTTATPLAVVLEERQAEVDHLLAISKAETAGARRARRIEARRRGRLSATPAPPRTVGAGLVPASSDATAPAGRSTKRTASGEKGGPRKKAAATGGPADSGGLSISQVTTAPTQTPPPVSAVVSPLPATVAGGVGGQPVSSPDAAGVPPDGQHRLSGSPTFSSSSSDDVPIYSRRLPPPIVVKVGSAAGAGAGSSGSGLPPLSPSRLPSLGDMERVAASLRDASHSAQSLLAVRFPSQAPSPSGSISNPAPSLVAPYDSDSDAEVAMMDEEVDDDASADA